MATVRTFLIVACCAWMLFDATYADVQVLQHGSYEGKSGDARNISVHIQGHNSGALCIDCQNQVQLDDGPDDQPADYIGLANTPLHSLPLLLPRSGPAPQPMLMPPPRPVPTPMPKTLIQKQILKRNGPTPNRFISRFPNEPRTIQFRQNEDKEEDLPTMYK